MYKWVVRAAILTGTLGLIGVVLIILNIGSLHSNVAEEKNEPIEEVQSSADVKEDLPVKIAAEKTKLVTKPKPEATKEPPKKPEPRAELKKEENVKKPEPKAVKLIKEKTEVPVAKKLKQPQKRLSRGELQDLVDAIYALKARTGHNINCIRIRKLESEQNNFALQQVEAYLSSKRFIISGKETVDDARDGINISVAAGCITVTVGTL